MTCPHTPRPARDNPLLTLAEAAAATGATVEQLRTFIADRWLQYYTLPLRDGRHRVVVYLNDVLKALDRWHDSQRPKPKADPCSPDPFGHVQNGGRNYDMG